jgi:8-oxo-dGTP pyrophosphatase MutT (NUDIX family)
MGRSLLYLRDYRITIGDMSCSNEPVRRRGAVGVVVRDGRMLVIRRARGVVAPLVYCFPGGGIESNESEEDALIREFREEVDLAIQPRRRLWECVTAWNVHLAWWLGDIAEGDEPSPNPSEVESIHWFTLPEMNRLTDAELLSSNREFLRLIERGEITLPL